MNPVSNSKSPRPLLAVLSGQTLRSVPVWFMRQAGRYLPEYKATRAAAGSFLDLCYNPELAAEVTLQPIRRFGFDAAILFSDILVVPDALGMTVQYKEGEGPVLDPLTSRAAIDTLATERVAEHLAPVYRAAAQVARALPPTCGLIGFAGGPWTVAAYMIEGHGGGEFHALVRMAYRDPDTLAALFRKLIDATVTHLVSQVQAGAVALQLFDTWAGIAAEPLFRRWCIAPVAEIVQRVNAACPGVPIIGFPKGAGASLARYVKETGINGVGLDPAVPLDWAARTIQLHVAVQGNLDPQLLVAGGPAMLAEADRILDTLANGPHIFNLGHGIRQETPPDHVAELVNHIRTRGLGPVRSNHP